MNYITDIAIKDKDSYNGIVEIIKGSKDKKELEEIGFSKLETVRTIFKKYPFYYGCFPQTLAGDGDALDLIIITRRELSELEIVPLDIIGIIKTIDNGEKDDKVFAIPYGELFTQRDLNKEIKRAIKFLITYKGKFQKYTKTDKKFYDSITAIKEIAIAHRNYNLKRPVKVMVG